jgi:hypothetical protein
MERNGTTLPFTVAKAFRGGLTERKPIHLQGNNGKDLHKTSLNNLMKEYKINHYITSRDKKAANCEKSNRNHQKEDLEKVHKPRHLKMGGHVT